MIAIIFAHPSHDSFNYAILRTVTDKLNAEGREYQVIDLYADRFDPVMNVGDLTHYESGGTESERISMYQDILSKSTVVFFIFPIWWGEAPAILKGFFDKVMQPGIAYHIGEDAIIPGLSVTRTVIITTSEAQSVIFSSYIEGFFIPYTLATIGLTGAEWYNCEDADTGSRNHREAFLARIASIA